MKDMLVWIDCEMTGLDPVADALVAVTPRVGISRAADLPLRFLVRPESS